MLKFSKYFLSLLISQIMFKIASKLFYTDYGWTIQKLYII